MPTKGYSLDPLQTDLVKEYTDNLVPLVTRPIIIESLKSGVVPAQLKLAIIVLILKKSVLMNFRPISNLPFLLKILQKVVLGVNFSNIYLTTNFWKLKHSAYRKSHSVKTAVLSVMDNLLTKIKLTRNSSHLFRSLTSVLRSTRSTIQFSSGASGGEFWNQRKCACLVYFICFWSLSICHCCW